MSRPKGRRLTDAEVLGIVAMLKAGHTQQAVADHYGTSQQVINCIAVGKSYGEVTGIDPATCNRRQILTEEDVWEILRLTDGGLKLADVAVQFGVSIGAVSSIRNGNNWGWLTGRRHGKRRPANARLRPFKGPLKRKLTRKG